MSQYANFYIRPFDDKAYVPIADYSRSSAVYHICGDSLLYYKIQALTSSDLDSFISSAREEQQEWRDRIADYKAQIATITTFNNSVDDKQRAISDVQLYIDECSEELTAYQTAENFFYFLKDLIPFGKEETPYLFAGIEIDPNVKED